MKQLSIGPQFGGKIYSQIIFFETERDFNNFIAINNNVGTPGIDVPKDDDKPDAVTDNDDQVDKEMMVANSNSSNNKMYEFGADANIVALVASAGANVSTIGDETISARVIGSTTRNYEYRLNNALRSYNKGVAVFTTTLGGLMFETCLSGQEYKYKPSSSNKDDNDNDNHNSINEDDENNNVNNKENESSEGEKKDTSTKVFDDQQNASKTTSNTTSSPLSERVENIQKFAKSFSPFVGKGKTKSASSDNDEDDSSSKSKTSGNDENKSQNVESTSSSSPHTSNNTTEATTGISATKTVKLAPLAPGESA